MEHLFGGLLGRVVPKVAPIVVGRDSRILGDEYRSHQRLKPVERMELPSILSRGKAAEKKWTKEDKEEKKGERERECIKRERERERVG